MTTNTKGFEMGILNALKHAARFSVQPKFSMFLTDGKGSGYELAFSTSSAEEMNAEWLKRIHNPEIMIVRCDGVNVDLSVEVDLYVE